MNDKFIVIKKENIELVELTREMDLCFDACGSFIFSRVQSIQNATEYIYRAWKLWRRNITKNYGVNEEAVNHLGHLIRHHYGKYIDGTVLDKHYKAPSIQSTKVESLKCQIKKEIDNYLDNSDKSIYLSNILKRNSMELTLLKNQESLDNIKLVIKKGSEENIYVFPKSERNNIADFIFDSLFFGGSKKIIFEAEIDAGLQSILLMKGYIYYEDVLVDADELIKELKAGGFEEYSKELENEYQYSNKLGEYARCIATKDESWCKLVMEKNLCSLEELITEVENSGQEELKIQLEKILSYLEINK